MKLFVKLFVSSRNDHVHFDDRCWKQFLGELSVNGTDNKSYVVRSGQGELVLDEYTVNDGLWSDLLESSVCNIYLDGHEWKSALCKFFV